MSLASSTRASSSPPGVSSPSTRQTSPEEILDLLPTVAVEVGLHPRAEVAGLPDVEHAIVPPDEAVDARRVGEGIREPDLPEVRPSSRANGLAEVAEREDPETTAEVEEPVEDLGARHRVVQCPMDRLHAGAEVRRERVEADVGHVGPHDPSSQLGGADRRAVEEGIVEPFQVHVQEGEVEAGVVRDEDRTSSELDERGQDRLDRRFPPHQEVVDAGQVRDERRDRRAGIDERLERAEALSAADPNGADLGDLGFAR